MNKIPSNPSGQNKTTGHQTEPKKGNLFSRMADFYCLENISRATCIPNCYLTLEDHTTCEMLQALNEIFSRNVTSPQDGDAISNKEN